MIVCVLFVKCHFHVFMCNKNERKLNKCWQKCFLRTKENCSFLVFQWYSAHIYVLQPLLISVFMQFKLPDGHDSFTLLSKSLNMLKLLSYKTTSSLNNACKQFNNRGGDCLI